MSREDVWIEYWNSDDEKLFKYKWTDISEVEKIILSNIRTS
jgi:hypothetical protein